VRSDAQLTDDVVAAVVVRVSQRPARDRGEAWSKCVAQRSFVEQRLKDGLRLTKVHRLLQRHGVDVPYITLYRFAAAELGFGGVSPTIPVADGEPGQEVQLDTGWMTLTEPDVTGKRRRFRAWIFTAVHSRHRFVYPTFRETTADAIEACEAAWRFFGGVFHVVIIDNTKAIVKRADPLGPLLVETFLEYAQARGFVIDTARVRHPKDKARVERAVTPTREDCFAGERLRTIAEARQRGEQWCRAEYGMRRHTRTQRLPLEHFEAVERALLLPAPTEPYDVPLWCEPRVGPDQGAVVDKAVYSLPRIWRGKKLRARADRVTVRFYWQRQLIKTCPRQPQGGSYYDPADYPPEKSAYARRDTAFLRRQAEAHGEAVGRFAAGLLSGPLPWTRMRRAFALLGLCKRFGDARLNEACAQAVDAEMYDVRRLRRMIERASASATATAAEPTARVIPLARYLRHPSQYALPLAWGGRSGTTTKPDGEES